jgi:hypothetical protein
MMANLPTRVSFFPEKAVILILQKPMGIKILQGRDFSGTPSDSTAMLLNKAAVAAMGLKNPVGMQMRFGRAFTVIGVTDNVIMGSPV